MGTHRKEEEKQKMSSIDEIDDAELREEAERREEERIQIRIRYPAKRDENGRIIIK